MSLTINLGIIGFIFGFGLAIAFIEHWLKEADMKSWAIALDVIALVIIMGVVLLQIDGFWDFLKKIFNVQLF